MAPSPVMNEEFTKTLGRVLGRPAIAPVPTLALRLAFGEMAEATLLASTRVSTIDHKGPGSVVTRGGDGRASKGD